MGGRVHVQDIKFTFFFSFLVFFFLLSARPGCRKGKTGLVYYNMALVNGCGFLSSLQHLAF